MKTVLFVLLTACSTDPTSDAVDRVSCNVDADCATAVGGGTCSSHVCRAHNECVSDHDCPSAEVCVISSHFTGLCTPPGTPASPEPTPTCKPSTTAAACPPSTACGADNRCHRIHCATDAQCPSGERCHEQCSSTGTAVGGVCEPDGVATTDCDTRCTKDSDCASGEVCHPSCDGTPLGVCEGAGVPAQVCPPNG